MVSGLFSAKTVVHLSTARATSSFEHAVAICIETPALNTSTMALIPRRVCIISSPISSATSQNISALHFFPAGSAEERDACGPSLPRGAPGGLPPMVLTTLREHRLASPRNDLGLVF